jgi:hypothetical protein
MNSPVKALFLFAGALVFAWLALGGGEKSPIVAEKRHNGENIARDPNSLEPGAQGESGSLDEEIESPKAESEPVH